MKKRRVLKKWILLTINYVQLISVCIFGAALDSLSIKTMLLFMIINIFIFIFTYKSNKYYKYID